MAASHPGGGARRKKCAASGLACPEEGKNSVRTRKAVPGRYRALVVCGAVAVATSLGGCSSNDKPGSVTELASGGPAVQTTAGTDTSSTSSWVTVTGDGFTAQLPAEPTESTQTAQTAVGAVEMHLYSVMADSDALNVGYGRFPAGSSFDLDASVQGSASTTGTTVAESTPSTVDGVEARSFRLVGKIQGYDITMFGTVAYRDGVMVQVQYVVQGDDVTEAPEIYQQVVDSIAFT